MLLTSMPYIKRLPKKQRTNNTEKRRERSKYYASSTWRKLRDGYFMQHPMCELCECTPAEDCHHIITPFTQKDIEYFFYNPNNLISLCKKCHGDLHGKHKEETLYSIYYDRENNYINNLIEYENV